MKSYNGRIYDLGDRPEVIPDDLAIATSLIDGGMRMAESAISNPWGSSLLTPEGQEKFDKARELIDQAIKLIKEVRDGDYVSN